MLISTTTGIFPAESQSWCLDPEITSREIRGYLSDSHVSAHQCLQTIFKAIVVFPISLCTDIHIFWRGKKLGNDAN